MQDVNLSNEVVEVAAEVAENEAEEFVKSCKDAFKTGSKEGFVAGCIATGIGIATGIVLVKGKDIWNFLKSKFGKSEESFDTIDVEVVADDVTE